MEAIYWLPSARSKRDLAITSSSNLHLGHDLGLVIFANAYGKADLGITVSNPLVRSITTF
jgi:hypothetical protein